MAEALEPRAMLCAVPEAGIQPASHPTLPEGWTTGAKDVLYIRVRFNDADQMSTGAKNGDGAKRGRI